MPMEATPREQLGAEAEAMNCTVEETVAPFEGWLTDTVANADEVKPRRSKRAKMQDLMKSALTRNWNYACVLEVV